MAISLLTPFDLRKFAHLYPESILADVPANEILIGYIEENPVLATGLLMAHIEDAHVYIDWLYVDEDYRRRGAAGSMVEFLIESCEQIEELDGISIAFSQEHEHIEKLLRSLNFFVVFQEGNKGFKTTVGDFPSFPVIGEKSGKVVFLGDVDVPLPVKAEDYMAESSAIIEDGKVKGLFLMKKEKNGLSIERTYNKSSSSANFPLLINKSMTKIKEYYPEDTELVVASINSKVEQIITTYIPVRDAVEIYFGTYPFGLE